MHYQIMPELDNILINRFTAAVNYAILGNNWKSIISQKLKI